MFSSQVAEMAECDGMGIALVSRILRYNNHHHGNGEVASSKNVAFQLQ